jgi:hypothetical protein
MKIYDINDASLFIIQKNAVFLRRKPIDEGKI